MNPMNRILQLPVRQLVGLAIAISAVIALIAGAWMWGTTPDYRVLFSNLPDRDGGAVVQVLNTMNVPYKYSEGGNAILVPANMVYDVRLKLASQGLPKGGITGFELMDQQKFGTTQFQEQVNYQRGLEGELSRTIESISSVQGARVHLAIPKPSVFLRDEEKPSASVLVNLYPGRALDRAQVSGILHLVSSSVPELTAENVSVIDQDGNLLTQPGNDHGLDPGQMAYVQQLEQSYTRRVVAILEPITGAENVRAQVNADVDFSQVEQTAETYKPNGDPANAAIRSQQSSDQQQSTTSPSAGSNGAVAAGIPGAASNQPTPAPAAANPAAPAAAAAAPPAPPQSSSSHKDTTTNYELDKTVQTKRMPVGTIKRLSLAIVVNQREKTDDKGKVTFESLDQAQLDQITNLAKEAVGFSQERGDTLHVVNAAFRAPTTGNVAETPIWKDSGNIQMAKDVGRNLAILAFALYLVFGLLKPGIKKLVAQAPQAPLAMQEQLTEGEPTLTLPQAQHVQSLALAKQLARDDPKVVASVVKNWVSKNG